MQSMMKITMTVTIKMMMALAMAMMMLQMDHIVVATKIEAKGQPEH